MRKVSVCCRELTARYTHLRSSNQIAVISPYSAQACHALESSLCRGHDAEEWRAFSICRLREPVPCWMHW